MGNAMPSGNLLLRSQWTELAQIEATKLNPPSKPWRSSLRMPKTQCSGPKNHVTLRAVFNAMRSTEVFGFNADVQSGVCSVSHGGKTTLLRVVIDAASMTRKSFSTPQTHSRRARGRFDSAEDLEDIGYVGIGARLGAGDTGAVGADVRDLRVRSLADIDDHLL